MFTRLGRLVVVDGHLGRGQGARLVGAQDLHRGDLLQGGQVSDLSAFRAVRSVVSDRSLVAPNCLLSRVGRGLG